MKTPDTNPQSEELVGQGPFRVEIQQPEEIYASLRESLSVRRGISSSIGLLRPEAGLFSEIEVNGVCAPSDLRSPLEGYTMELKAAFRDPENSYWLDEEVAKLRKTLGAAYGERRVKRTRENNFHLIIISRLAENIQYVVTLGSSEEKDAWIRNVERSNEFLKEEEYARHLPESPDVSGLTRDLHEAILRNLIKKPSILHPLKIRIASIRAYPAPSGFIPFRSKDEFVTKLQLWDEVLERAINSVSQAKGIPQSGVLIIRPPHIVNQSVGNMS